jgi:hypothetical protein
MDELGVEYPPGMMKRVEDPDVYAYQGGVEPYAGRFDTGRTILAQDPEIQALRQELMDNLRRSDIFHQLKGQRRWYQRTEDKTPPLRRPGDVGRPEGEDFIDDGMDFADEGTGRMRGERRPTLDERADVAARQAGEVDQVCYSRS